MSRASLVPAFTILIALGGYAAGCSKGSPAPAAEATPAAPAAQAEPPKPMPAQLPDVLARVNGEVVSKAEFELTLQQIEQQNGAQVPAERRDEVYRRLLDQIVGQKLLRQEVAVRKVIVPDAAVKERIDEIKKQFPSEDVFKQMLSAQKITLEKLQSDQRDALAISKMLEDLLKDKVTASPEQVTTFYQQNPDQFKQPERVRASHILVALQPNADAAAKAKVGAKAEDILKQVKAGKDFAALAKQHSEDPGSAINGGDLGFFGPGQMVGPFNDVAFKLAPGAVSDLVETQFGFHIIKVAEKQPARAIPLDEVRDKLKDYLENLNKQRETTSFVAGLRAKGKVEILV